ncbi:MAG: sugar ABC transporter substrate-binding protein, partial [Campylobacterota bacterium]|nr:sugar ABC transporter substrate-binding protein [Campylobacterota bacterium]
IISIRTDANEYMRALVEGARLFAKTIGSEDKVIPLFNHGNGEKQVQDLQLTLQKTGKNAILFMDPNDESAARMLADVAKEHGVYFSTVWNKPKDFWPWNFGPYWVTYTTTDYVYSGTAISQEIAKKINGKGDILVIQGRLDNSSNKGRVKGLKNVMKKYPDIKILESSPANWSRVESSMLVTKWFSKYSDEDVQAIWAANDEMALGAVDIMREMGLDKKMPIVGVDGTSEAVKAVISKELIATVSVDPYWQSGMGLSFAYQAYLGNIKPSELPNDKRAFYSKSQLITSENAESFLKNYIENPPKIDYSKLWEGKYSRPMK